MGTMNEETGKRAKGAGKAGKVSVVLEGIGTTLEVGKACGLDLAAAVKWFVYLEEVPGGKWRLTYTRSIIPDIALLEAIRIVRHGRGSIVLEGIGTVLELGGVYELNLEATGRRFVYLEEMPNGRCRLTYTKSLVPDIALLDAIRLVRQTPSTDSAP